MSWWDTSSISNLASQALKNAQKKIDKVLDIEADEKAGRARKKKESLQAGDSHSVTATDTKEEKTSGQDFWSGWMGKAEEEEKASSPTHGSSWHLPWASPSQETQASPSVSDTPSTDWSSRASGRRSRLSSRRMEASKESPSSLATSQEESQRESESTAQEGTGKVETEEKAELVVAEEKMKMVVEEEKAERVVAGEKTEEIVAEDTSTGTAESLPQETTSEQVSASEAKNFSEPAVETVSTIVEQKLPEDASISSFEGAGISEDSDHNISRENRDKLEPEINEPYASKPLDRHSEVEELDKTVPVSDEPLERGLLSQGVPEEKVQESCESGWQDADSDVIIEGDDDRCEIDNTCDIPPHHEQTDVFHPETTESSSSEKEIHGLEEPNKDMKASEGESVEDSYQESQVQGFDETEQFSAQGMLHETLGANEEGVSLGNNAPQLPCSSDDNEPKTEGSITAPSSGGEGETHNSSVDTKMGAESKEVVDASVHLLTVPDVGEETTSMSSDMSLINDPDQTSVEDVDDAKSSLHGSQGSEDKSLSQEYEKVGSVSGASQVVSLDGSALSSDDCLQSSYELDFEGVTNSTIHDSDPVPDLAESTGSSDTSRLDSSADTVVVGRVHHDSDSVDAGYSLFGNDSTAGGLGQEGALDKADISSPGGREDLASSDSSYVKSLIQEAMDDLSNKTEDSGSDNHSNSEVKSEGSKVDSEMEKSVYSGHESSDDIETNTSSDIEILSAPHSNGEAPVGGGGSKFHSPFDFTPLRIAQHGGQHRDASDSRSTSSSNSKAGEGERLSPERAEGASWRDDELSHQELASVKEEGPDSPYHPERLLKLAESVVQQELRGGQKLAEMAEVLQARETKLISLSKENHSLAEDVSILKCQLKKAEEARDAEAADLDALTQEFTVRIGEAEKKMQTVLKEKDRIKQQLTSAEKELERRSADADVEAMLEEKRQQVEELLQEGEKLSKQQLQSSTIIKKLRAKEKESDTTITSQKKKLEEQTTELDHLKVVLNSKEEMEKKQNEAISQLNTAVQKQEKDLVKLRSDLEDAQEKSRGLQVALDNSYKEIAELHKSNATQDSKAQEAALSAETHVREELKAAMEREQMRFKQEREAFIMQADDLRMDMARLEKEHSRREDLLRQEIAHLQIRLQEDEARSQELTQSVSSATRPLLRQIENLQATFGAQSNAWERVEKNLTDRLAETQTSLAVAQEKERSSSQQFMELSAKVAALEASNSGLRQEKANLSAKIEGDKSRLEELQDTRNSVVAQFESSKRLLSEELAQLKMDKMHLESQLNVERTRVETEKKKGVALEEQLRLAERPRSRGTPSPSPSMSVSRQESIVGSVHEGYPGNMMNWSFHDESDSGSTVGISRASVYDSLRQSGAAIAVENMSSQLKLREGEIAQLQSEISRLERTRESMARELVNLSNQNEELQESKVQYEQLQQQYKELNQRYSAILQMYGEKEEQVQELRLDLQDVKEMYKTQIDALMAK